MKYFQITVKTNERSFYRELLRLFVNPELIKWSGLCEIYEKELKSTEVFSDSTEDGRKRWTELRNRVVEHVSLKNNYFLKTNTVCSFFNSFQLFFFCILFR